MPHPSQRCPRFADALGIVGSVGEPVSARGISGRVERALDHHFLVRLEQPVIGLLSFFAFGNEAGSGVHFVGYLFEDDAGEYARARAGCLASVARGCRRRRRRRCLDGMNESAAATSTVRSPMPRVFQQLLVNTLMTGVTSSFLWFALTFWVYLETRSVVATGVIGGAFSISSAVLGPLFGTFVDRHRKKTALMGTTAIAVVCFAAATSVFSRRSGRRPARPR